MAAGVTSFRSILDKPLTQLTEDDISQLTREDCRNYLKEKGMRRPSWNKSQAIQQVISLKALLETTEDSSAGALRSIIVSKQPPPVTSHSADSAKETSDTNNNNLDETAPPCRQNDSPPPLLDCPPEEADNKASFSSHSWPAPTGGLVGQMTIFYCGKVNVYDGVPPDKAREIMHLAASPVLAPLDDQIHRPALALPYHSRTASNKHVFVPSNAAISPTMPTEKTTEFSQLAREKGNITYDHVCLANRKISLQRYLEKKKDRGRFKGGKSLVPTSSFELYLNHQVRTHVSNEKSTGSRTSSPPQHGVLHALCNSVDGQLQNASFSVDLNKDVQEH